MRKAKARPEYRLAPELVRFYRLAALAILDAATKGRLQAKERGAGA